MKNLGDFIRPLWCQVLIKSEKSFLFSFYFCCLTLWLSFPSTSFSLAALLVTIHLTYLQNFLFCIFLFCRFSCFLHIGFFPLSFPIFATTFFLFSIFLSPLIKNFLLRLLSAIPELDLHLSSPVTDWLCWESNDLFFFQQDIVLVSYWVKAGPGKPLFHSPPWGPFALSDLGVVSPDSLLMLSLHGPQGGDVPFIPSPTKSPTTALRWWESLKQRDEP